MRLYRGLTHVHDGLIVAKVGIAQSATALHILETSAEQNGYRGGTLKTELKINTQHAKPTPYRGWRPGIVRGVTGGVLVLAAAAAILLIRAINSPPLKVSVSEDTVTVDARTLGEYPTSVTKIVVRAKHGRELLDLQADSHTQIGKFVLHTGQNSPAAVHTDRGTFRVAMPAGGEPFLLKANTEYQIEIQNGSLSSGANFTLGSAVH